MDEIEYKKLVSEVCGAMDKDGSPIALGLNLICDALIKFAENNEDVRIKQDTGIAREYIQDLIESRWYGKLVTG